MAATNVTREQMRRYLDVFNQTYKESVDTFLPKYKDRLRRYPLLEKSIIGYVSTQFGAGYEYAEGPKETSLRLSSKPIEEAFAGAPPRICRMAPMFVFQKDSGMASLSIRDTFPFRLASSDSSLTIEDVDFRVGSWHRVILLAQLSGDRSAAYWSEAKALARAKDEVLVALTNVRQSELSFVTIDEFIARFKRSTVLVLGDYHRRTPQLEQIASSLRSYGYSPILVKDIPDHPYQDLRQKVSVIGSVSRFVVVEDSTPSGHLLEIELAKLSQWPTIVLRQKGLHSSYMTAGLSATSKIIQEVEYTPGTLDEVLRTASQGVEKSLESLRKTYASIYPWRNQPTDK